MASDTDWYFEPKVVDNLVWLTKKLMAQYNIPADHVIRHYDVTGKICPKYFVEDEAAWKQFKNNIRKALEE